jgi:predicted PurR-regulated permease PerM
MTREELGEWVVRGFGVGIGVLLVLVLATVMEKSANVIVLVLISVLLASALDPPVGWIRARTRLTRVQTIMLLYLVMLVIAALLLLLVVPAAINQGTAMSERLPQVIDDARAWAQTADPPILGTVVERLVDAVDSGLGSSAMSQPDPDAIVEAGLTAADAAISVITVLTLIFFWLISREPLQRFSLALLPAGQRRGVREAWNRIEERMGYWVRGQLTLMTTIGVLTTSAYLVLGLENAILLGVIAGLAEIIPIVGPALGAIPALISAFLTGGPELALLVAGVYVVIQVLEGQILVPIVMRRSVGLPPFLVIVSLLMGGAVAGLIGALLAVPVAAAAVVVLENMQARRHTVPLSPPESDADEDDEDEDEDQVAGGPDMPMAGQVPVTGATDPAA